MSYRPSNHKAELAAVLAQLRGLAVLDVGCGDGAMVRHLTGLGARAVGLEIDDAQLARARAAPAVGGESYRVGRGEALPFSAGEMDAVLYFNSFHHLPVAAMAPALAEAARVLVPGGRLVVIEPLAEGPFFETLRPLEDETEVRAAALAVLRSPPPHLLADGETTYLNTVRFRNVEQFLAAALAPDPGRRLRLPAVEAELRRRFAANARMAGEWAEFDQPMRLSSFIRQ